jgi:hypothetical protein
MKSRSGSLDVLDMVLDMVLDAVCNRKFTCIALHELDLRGFSVLPARWVRLQRWSMMIDAI